MAKAQSRPSKRVKPSAKPERPQASERRSASPPERAEASQRPRSQPMRLAAEVERLQIELNAARAQLAVLEARADIDPLTDIFNRRGFERELKRALAYVKRYGTPAALVYIDLDGFKAVNDRHGHAGGDAVLKAVAMVLGRQVRASDLVARIGGDEFAVLLWNLAEADAQVKALALEQAIGRMTASHAGAVLMVGASAGVAMLLPLDQPAEVLERADRAMYARKALQHGKAAAE